MSERTTSDQEFVRLFSPKILERLEEDVFDGAVHVFISPPGGGKTTLLRAFTPSSLRAFWNARNVQELDETFQRLVARRVIDEHEGPQLLGVFLSCASGYADLPPGLSEGQEGLFRALLDCRIVLRSLRSLAVLLGAASTEDLHEVEMEYDESARDLKAIPRSRSVKELVNWAEGREREVYSELDSLGSIRANMPGQVRFEGIQWLQAVRFIARGKLVAPKRLLMIDDLQKLRKAQRTLLIEEITDSRPNIPVWVAERSIALGDELLSQGARQGRDVRHYALDELWGAGRGQYQFANFAQNVLDRRLDAQAVIPKGLFSQYLSSELTQEDMADANPAFDRLCSTISRARSNPRYSEWVEEANRLASDHTLESLRRLFTLRTLLTRDEGRRQMTLELTPLSADELGERDNSQLQAASEIFMSEEAGFPYYYGLDRLCVMATSNVEELLGLAAALYEAIRAKQVLRKPELLLSAREQDRLLRDVAKKKRDFIPKNNTEGTRAQRLLDAIGSYCRERTFLSNAPYAPGVTGIRLSDTQMGKLLSLDSAMASVNNVLRRVLSECVAENLFVLRPSASTVGREGGTIFYLNRTLCALYGLPLQLGGWQDVETEDLAEWMERGRTSARRKLLETH